MSAYSYLGKVCKKFEAELGKVSGELISVNPGGSFEDAVSKKTSDLTLLTAKLRLLIGKEFAVTPEITQKEKGEHTINEYEESVVNKILEQTIVKSLTQMKAVKELIIASDSSLDHELIQRRSKIMESLCNFRQKDSLLRELLSTLKEKELKYEAVRERFSLELCDHHNSIDGDVETSGPMYRKLVAVVSKLEMMRWFLGRLVMLRNNNYDWLADPCNLCKIFKITSQYNTIEMFFNE